MPPAICVRCNLERALIIRPKNRQKLCRTCFYDVFEAEIHETIVRNNLFASGERIAIGASGGKDSTVLASVLKTLNERHHYGLDLVLLSIDEGIKGYRDDSLETVKRNAEQYGMSLEILGYDQLYGWTMDQVVSQIGKKGNCTYCGVFRRQALDRGAAKLNIKHVVTGHNADDVAETVMMNLLRGDLPRLARATSIVTASSASEIKRSKPLKYAYEKEIVLYAHHKKLDYFTTECVYSPEAFRGSARTLIKDLERIRPSAILDVVRSGEDMAKLVPAEVSGRSTGKVQDILVANGEELEMGGCSSSKHDESVHHQQEDVNGQQSGNDLETEITASTIKRRDSAQTISSHQQVNKARTARKLPKQRMGTCSRCGYLSSQKICKACSLLEGLNKSKPKTEIHVGIEEEENSPTLTRRMEGLHVAVG
ncbi:nucleotidyltransferase [Agyrium rufum]|nr:nucleotidyltransferase [Agyrium rufum]